MRFRHALTRLGTFGHTVLVNIVAGMMIVGAVVFAISTTLLSAQSQLSESAQLAAQEWVVAALNDRDAVRSAIEGRIRPSEGEYLRSIAGIGHVYRFELLRFDGSPAFASLPGPPNARPAAPREEPRLLREPVLREGAGTPGDPRTSAMMDLPVTYRAEPIGLVRVHLDHTAAADAQEREALASIANALVLGGLGLANCLFVGILLFRQRAKDRHIYHLAHHDPLTGIANRAVFQEQLSHLLGGRRPADRRIALHLVDLDNFKAINDSLGHQGGDDLLRAVADALRETLRNGDVIARVGGDEFAVIQREVEAIPQAAALAERMLGATRDIRAINGIPVSPTLSIGVAFAPEHAAGIEELQRAADAALYRAKSLGRNQHVVFEAGMDDELRYRNELRVMVRQALEDGSFVLHYQPLHSSTGALCGFEALIRLPDGNGGLVAPGEFIPIAEEMGLTPELGAWVLREACRAAAAWRHELAIAVNLSVQQFNGTLCEVVARALADSGLAPTRLELEITESMLIAEPEEVIATLSELKDLGVRVAMDDFGTGYSSLSYVWKFPFDKLKVDRSCFKALGSSESVAKVLKIIAMMTNAMEIGLVAEGIESETQRDFACANGYDQLQGFLYGRPMPDSDVHAYMAGCAIARHSVAAAPALLAEPPARLAG